MFLFYNFTLLKFYANIFFFNIYKINNILKKNKINDF